MYGKQTTLRMDKNLYAKLEKTARLHFRSVSDMIRLILAENIERYGRTADTPLGRTKGEC